MKNSALNTLIAQIADRHSVKVPVRKPWREEDEETLQIVATDAPPSPLASLDTLIEEIAAHHEVAVPPRPDRQQAEPRQPAVREPIDLVRDSESSTLPARHRADEIALSAKEARAPDFVVPAANARNTTATAATADTTAPTLAISTIATDNLINASEDDSNVTISGTSSGAEEGRTVTVGLNSQTYTGTVSSNAWSVTVSAAQAQALTDGTAYTVTANVSDAAGNAATPATRSLTRDATAPTFTSGTTANFAENASGTAYDATADSDSGVTYTLGGTDAARFSINSSTGAVTFGSSPNYEAPTDSGGNNIYDLSVTATDTAGNTTARAVAITVTDVDDTGPTVSGVAITSASGIQSSTLNAGDVVSVTVTLNEATTVTGTPNLALDLGGTTVQAAYASGSGTTALVFTYTILSGQTDANGISIAANSLSLNGGTLKDAAGNNATLTHSAVADNASYLVDTTTPTLDLAAASDTGSSSTDNITSDTTPTFTVTGAAGTTLTLFNDTNSSGAVDGGESLGTVTFGGGVSSGSITSSALSADRYTNIKVIGSAGSASIAHEAVTVDTAASAPTLDLSSTSDTINGTDNVTYDTTPTFAVTGESGATVTLFNDTNSNGAVNDGESLGTTTLTGTTNGSITSSALAGSAGGTSYTTIKVIQTDAAGNTSAASSAHASISIKTGVTVPTLDLDAGSDTGSSSTDNITSDTTPTFTVTGAAGTTLTLFNDADNNGVVAASGESLGTVTFAGGVSSGSITSSALAAGTYAQIKVISSESANAVSGSHDPVVISTATPTVSSAVTDDFGDANWDNWVRPTLYGQETMTGTAMQLTTASGDQKGGALYNSAFSSSQIMTFEFRYTSSGGSGADGISFFLVDGANTAFNLGYLGGYLGYGYYTSVSQGLDGGWLGVGLLEYAGGGVFVSGGGAGIGLLGSESASTPYGYIASMRENSMGGNSIDGGSRRVKVTLGDSTTNTVTVQWDYNDDGTYDYTPINAVDLDSYSSKVATRPATLKFGFAAATGGVTNLHSIDWVTITTGTGAVAITSASGVQNSLLTAGDVVSVTVTLSEATTVTGTPQLALNIGGTTVQADYASGSGSTQLVFTYTILSGQTDANGISIAANSLTLNGGTIRNAAGTDATITHVLVEDNASFKVDTTAPTVTTATGAYTASSNTLVLTGTNFDTLLESGESAATDIKARLDWSKLSWDINGDNATTADVSFTTSDISSAVVTDGTHLTIVLTGAKGTALEATSGYGGVTSDTVDITAGWAKDTAGNAAATDLIANMALQVL